MLKISGTYKGSLQRMQMLFDSTNILWEVTKTYSRIQATMVIYTSNSTSWLNCISKINID